MLNPYMKIEEFLKLYANTPLPDRDKIFDGVTLNETWEEAHDLENEMRPMRLRQQELIKSAVNIWKALEDEKYPQKI